MENENKKKGWGLFVLGLVVGLLAALIITSMIFQKSVSLSETSLVDERVLKKIESLETVIHDRFYLREMTDSELEEGIYRGMMEALDDPYSEYYTYEELNTLLDHTEGVYYGIGAYISLDAATNLPRISGIISGTPAEEADLRADDIIYMVDGESMEGMSLSEAVSRIKGPENTEVVLTIVRSGEKDYLEIPVVRKKVESPTVEFEMLDDGMAYISIAEFDEVTVDQFAEALAMAKGSDMKGLILDLRANPGGGLGAVVDIARMILPEGMIVYTEDKDGKRSEYTCDGSRELTTPMVVLVDGNSASAAEILAGAIQDHNMGILVGTTTFGKGIVQQIIQLDDGSAVKITISSYYTPNGRNIHGTGIEPDVKCEFDAEAYYNTEDHYDNQLERAKEELRKIM